MKRALISAALCTLLTTFALPAAATTASAGTGPSCSAGTVSYPWSFNGGPSTTVNPRTHGFGSLVSGAGALPASCSGDDCGCGDDYALCVADCPPSGDPNRQACLHSCVQESVTCALHCCGGYRPGQ